MEQLPADPDGEGIAVFDGELVPSDQGPWLPTAMGDRAVARRTSPQTRAEATERWLREKGTRSPHTAARYRRDIEAFFAWCDAKGYDIAAMLPMHISEYAADLADGYDGERSRDGVLSASTRAGRINAVSSFYRFLAQQSPAFVPNPAQHAPRPRVSQRSRTRALSREELDALRAEARRRGPMEYALVQLLAGTGLRISEALNTEPRHLKREGAEWYLYVRRKGVEDRVPVQVPEPAAKAVHRYLRGRRSGPIFLDREGRRLSRQAASNRIRFMAKAIGVADRHVSPHSLRHTATTLALSAGVPIRDVQVQMGHASTQTTARYDQELRERDNPTVAALAAIIDDGLDDDAE